jgi:DNA-binding transcriptional MerR regulator
MERVYTIGEASEELGMPASTLRYYDKKGLFPDVARSQGGLRVYTEDDLEWARFIERLKASGMPIAEIKEYIDLYRAGDSTIEQRRKIVNERLKAIDAQLADLRLARDFIYYKCWFYDVAAESGTCDTPRSIPMEDLPPKIARIKRKCRINRY